MTEQSPEKIVDMLFDLKQAGLCVHFRSGHLEVGPADAIPGQISSSISENLGSVMAYLAEFPSRASALGRCGCMKSRAFRGR